MRSWPDWMPKPRQDGYSYETVDRRTKTDMEISGIYRVEFDTDEGRASCQIDCDQLQASYFEKLERDILNQGSVWFKFPLWYGGKLVESVVRFADRPKLTAEEAAYSTYSLTLDVQQREELMCAETLLMLDCFEPCQIVKMSKALNDFMTKTLAGSTALPAL